MRERIKMINKKVRYKKDADDRTVRKTLSEINSIQMLVKQTLYRNKCYPGHRYISLSIRKLIKNLVKKYQLKHCPKHRQHFHFEKRPYRTFRQKRVQKCRPKGWQMFVPEKRLY